MSLCKCGSCEKVIAKIGALPKRMFRTCVLTRKMIWEEVIPPCKRMALEHSANCKAFLKIKFNTVYSFNLQNTLHYQRVVVLIRGHPPGMGLKFTDSFYRNAIGVLVSMLPPAL